MNTFQTAGTDRRSRGGSRRGAIWKVSLIVMIAIVVLACAGAAPVRAASLSMNRQQLVLFTDYAAKEKQKEEEKAELDKERRAQGAFLAIKKKYGKNTILKGVNFEEGATGRARNAQIGGHKA